MVLTRLIRGKGYQFVCFIRIQGVKSVALVGLFNKAPVMIEVEIFMDVDCFLLVDDYTFDPGVEVVCDSRP